MNNFISRNRRDLYWFFFIVMGSLLLISFVNKDFFFYKIISKHPTFLVVLISAVIAFFSYSSQRFLAKAKNTIDFQVNFHNSSAISKHVFFIRDCMSVFTADDLKKIALDDYSNFDKSNLKKAKKLGKSATELLNTLERLAVAVKHDVYDDQMLYNNYKSFFLKIYDFLSPWVIENQKQNPRWYCEFSNLMHQWKHHNKYK